MEIRILTVDELKSCVTLDEDSIEAVALGYTRLAQGKATLPPIMQIFIPENKGEIDVKSAYVHGVDRLAVKIASGFLDNTSKGLPSGSGLMVVFSTLTGMPEAVLLDNGYLTFLRTGCAGAIAARHLAPQTIETAGVIGSGIQARFQIQGLKAVRNFERLLVYGIEAAEVEEYAAEMRAELGLEVVAAASVDEVVRQSQFVVTATPSQTPYLKAESLHPGLHITCMGSDAEHKQELYPQVFEKADRIVCDRKQECFRLGELHHALEAGILQADSAISELGELTSGQKPGRQSEDEITVCDLTGIGVQDTQIANLAFKRAAAAGMGTVIHM